jgi:hypothetical protein
MNKKGYVLIYAIGVIALLMLLAATLSSITLSRSTIAKNQRNFILATMNGRTKVEAAASDLAEYFTALNNLAPEEKRYLNDITMITDIENKFATISENYDVLITPLEKERYSFSYLIEYQDDYVTAQKTIYLSMMPSFLFFALGSNTDINLNGGAYIDGNVYVNNNLYLANTANYIQYNDRLSINTAFSTLSPNSTIFFSDNNNILACISEHANCFIVEDNNFIKNSFYVEDINVVFENQTPITRKYPNNFLTVEFNDAFLYYIEEIITTDNINNYGELNIDNITDIITRMRIDDIIDEYDYASMTKSTLIDENCVITNDNTANPQGWKVIKGAINFPNQEMDNQPWIIVDGDLEIRNYNNNDVLNINANFLVNGDVSITGYVTLNSTIYALGEGIIQNASINVNSTSDEQLVLLTREKIKFSQINEFVDADSITEDDNKQITIQPTIKGYFYTDSVVEIYTINSYLTIEGSIFSNNRDNQFITNSDAKGMLINSYQGDVNENDDGSFNFNPTYSFKNNRFAIKHSTKILSEQPKGLPLTKQFNFLFEKTKIKRS